MGANIKKDLSCARFSLKIFSLFVNVSLYVYQMSITGRSEDLAPVILDLNLGCVYWEIKKIHAVRAMVAEWVNVSINQ